MSINPTMIIGFDPSTTRTGWSCVRHDGKLLDCGAITLDSMEAMRRPRELFRQTQETVARASRLEPDAVDLAVAIEWPDQHTNRVQKGRGFGAGLARYGTAPGIVYGACAAMFNVQLIWLYTKNQWSPGKVGKAAQRRRCICAHPLYAERYEKRGDTDGDIADAIGIAEFAWRTLHLERASA